MRIGNLSADSMIRRFVKPCEPMATLASSWIHSGCVSADAGLTGGKRVAGAVERFVVGIMDFAKGAEGIFAGPAIDGEIAACDVGIAQQFGAQILRRRAKKLRPWTFRTVGRFEGGNLLLGNL